MSKAIKLLFIYLAVICVFFLVLEGIFRKINFEYYPLDTGLQIPGSHEIFQKYGEYYKNAKGQKILINKPKDEFRIFIFGGSVVELLGNCHYLKTLLAKVAPHKNINIVNSGYSGWGTNRLLPLVKEALDYAPDLFIVYSGHNEFEEEFVKKILYRNSKLVKFDDFLLRHSYFYKFLSMQMRKFMIFLANKSLKTDNANPHSILKLSKRYIKRYIKKKSRDTFFYKEFIYNNYRDNLTKMIEYAKDAEVPIIISTLSFNREIRPFRAPDNFYQLCLEKMRSGLLKGPGCFDEALDRDLEPHVATTTSNRIVKEIAVQYNVPLVDFDKIMVRIAPNHIPGHKYFEDHCHLKGGVTNLLHYAFFEIIKKHSLIK